MSNAVDQKHKMLADALERGHQDDMNASDQHGFLTDAEVNMLSSVPGALALLSANGRQVWSNETATKLTSSDTEWLAKINPQSAVEAYQAISDAVFKQREERATIKVQQVDADGIVQTRTLQLSCKSYQPAEPIMQEPLALVTINDLTAENELSIRLEEAHRENDDKNRFFSSMSHELRTPLNAIIGFAELLEGKAAIQINDAKRLEYAGLISGSANHLLGLINDILDLSRLDAGKNEPVKEAIDLEASLNTVVRSMMPIAMRKGVDVIFEEDGSIPSLQSDKRALTQIITNLLSNAIKFSHANSAVRIKTVRLRNRIKIVIADNGIGMDTETQSKLGGLFYQSGDVIRGEYGGSGLGLSIVYKLVDLLGGKIAINSQHGEGTTVSVILPMGNDAAKPVPSASGTDVVFLSAITENKEQIISDKAISSGVTS